MAFVYGLLWIIGGIISWIIGALVYPILGATAAVISLFPWTIIAIRKKKRQAGELGEDWYKRSKGSVLIDNKQLSCLHCENKTFQKREGILQTTWVSLFMFFPALNQSAVCYECIQCGYLSWFSRPKESFLEKKTAKEKTPN